MLNQLKTVLLLGVLTTLVAGAASAFAPQWWGLFVVAAVAFNLVMYFFSDRIVLRMHGARAVDFTHEPALWQMNDELAREAGIPAPRLFVIDADYANAFATGRGPGRSAVAVTRGLLRRLSRRELRGVLAHEIAHVANRDVLIASVAAMLAAVVSGIANAAQFSYLFGGGGQDRENGGGAGSLLYIFVAPIAASIVQLAISRSREFVADETAARLTRDPEALALALERLHASVEQAPAPEAAPATASLFIVSPFSGGRRMLVLFSTHPPVEQRIQRLRTFAHRLSMAA